MAAINPPPLLSPSSSSSSHRLGLKRKPDDLDSSSSSRFRNLSNSTVALNSKVSSTFQLNDEFNTFEIQFFVKMMISGVKTLVLRANYNDTIGTIHDKVYDVTGIPLNEQRLIYEGKQLRCEQTLKDCCIENDAVVQLVGRMRSTGHPVAWRSINDIVSVICGICRREIPSFMSEGIKQKLDEFMGLSNGQVDVKTMGGFDDEDDGIVVENIRVVDLCRIFMEANAPQVFVMLYMSRDVRSKESANDCIRGFMNFLKGFDEDVTCACVVLEFCKLLRGASTPGDSLYVHCRSTLGSIVKNMTALIKPKEKIDDFSRGTTYTVTIQDLFPFLKELGHGLVLSLASIPKSFSISGPSLTDVCDFSAFLHPVLGFIRSRPSTENVACGLEGGLPSGEEAYYLSFLFTELVSLMEKCLIEIEKNLSNEKKKDSILDRIGSSQYLSILREVNNISELFPDREHGFWVMMRRYQVAVCSLIVRHAKRGEDYNWISMHREVLDFESRSHLALLMFPEVKEEYHELHEMLIDRSQLLAESFEYISQAKPSSLHGALFMEFKNEEATGPGVLREWFCLVFQAIFDPQNALFVACPEDRQKLFPNPASKVNPKHLRYFRFTGRMIALALMHKIQVGVVLDRAFFLQLAGRPVLMEDIRDADPCIHNSLKQILEMDANVVDSDCLGLTFVTEVEEFGTRKVVDLCKGGRDIVVNSFNRREYVNLIIKHHFVTSISEQVSAFANGFSDILHGCKTEKEFFGSIEPEDLDGMLRGSGSEICVEDWKAHTDYHGYMKSNRQINSFWKIVEKMNAEEKRNLLFFWTSVKYLPVKGFCGLPSRLSIHKAMESENHLPTSHTCFYELHIPPYRTKLLMQKRLDVIIQEHVNSGFGTS